MKQPPEIIILRETVLQSWASDAGTFALFGALIGIGWLMDSTAMQWVGAIVGFIAILSKSLTRSKRRTIAQARQRLDELEAGK